MGFLNKKVSGKLPFGSGNEGKMYDFGSTGCLSTCKWQLRFKDILYLEKVYRLWHGPLQSSEHSTRKIPGNFQPFGLFWTIYCILVGSLENYTFWLDTPWWCSLSEWRVCDPRDWLRTWTFLDNGFSYPLGSSSFTISHVFFIWLSEVWWFLDEQLNITRIL